MFRCLRLQPRSLSVRCYSTQPQGKASVKLIAELRKLTEVSITKAREALTATNNDLDAALEWLQKDLATSGAKKAAKVQGRTTNQGLISISVLANGASAQTGKGYGGIRAAMIELNCETDFVGRNDLFGKLAADIAHTAAYISDVTGAKPFQPCSLDLLNDAPLLSKTSPGAQPAGTVASAIRDTIAKVGENITLRRAISVIENAPQQDDLALRLGSYVHGSVNDHAQGRIGTLALLALRSKKLPNLLPSDTFHTDLERLERALARQIVGFETYSVEGDSEYALYNQPFMMFAGEDGSAPVRDALANWSVQKGLTSEQSASGGIAVLEFAKWTVGEGVNDVSSSSS